ncbi:unnamed protein product [Anisakis simplex]|uniref:Astacin domain-containing protein n=1 Tax=Anisakis simplex TaxID=6269 RepID=A0A0M3JGZ7_ANISI|nr:unnamed protein product [Anisakis simplex]
MTYFSGNPFVEKTSGILHFYKHSSEEKMLNVVYDGRAIADNLSRAAEIRGTESADNQCDEDHSRYDTESVYGHH